MSKGYYRVDAVRPDQGAGDSAFLRASSKEDAAALYQEQMPEMSGWDLTVTRIKREEFPVDREVDELVIPPIQEVIPGANPDDPSDEDDRNYNAWATRHIQEHLEGLKAAGDSDPRILTRYPHDTVEEGNDSRDLVTLGRHGEVVVIDTGAR